MTECADFLDTIWGTEDRGLYTLVVAQENPDGAAENNDVWHTYAFRWPKGRQKAVERVFRADEAGANVYICPALYSAPKRLREHVAGSHCLWMDSDGNAPMTFDAAVPAPSPASALRARRTSTTTGCSMSSSTTSTLSRPAIARSRPTSAPIRAAGMQRSFSGRQAPPTARTVYQ